MISFGGGVTVERGVVEGELAAGLRAQYPVAGGGDGDVPRHRVPMKRALLLLLVAASFVRRATRRTTAAPTSASRSSPTAAHDRRRQERRAQGQGGRRRRRASTAGQSVRAQEGQAAQARPLGARRRRRAPADGAHADASRRRRSAGSPCAGAARYVVEISRLAGARGGAHADRRGHTAPWFTSRLAPGIGGSYALDGAGAPASARRRDG